jgi:hypothetical protein
MTASVALQITGMVFAGIFGWAYVRFTLAAHTKELKEQKEWSDKSDKDLTERINASFKRIDSDSDRLLKIETSQSGLLSLSAARAEFVSKRELELQMQLVNQVMTSIQKEVDRDGKKLDKILEILDERD